MQRNHRSWHEWITRDRKLVMKKNEIVLVHGFYKAKSWAVACLHDKSQRMHFALHGGIPYAVDFDLTLSSQTETVRSPESRKSETFQSRESHVKDVDSSQPPQLADVNSPPPDTPTDCVFMLLYRARYVIKKKRPLLLKLEGSADPGDLSGDDSSEDEDSVPMEDVEEVEVVMEPEYSKPRLPVARILDYLLASTDADVAIVPDMFIDPQSGLAVDIDSLTDDELRQRFPYMVTSSGAATLKLELDGSPKDVFARCPNSLPNSRGVGDGDNMKLPDRTAMRQIPAREKSPQGHSVLRSDIASKLSSYIEKSRTPAVRVI
ncbi:hypothetical protein QCA50_013659 [Cerrena zonata]|uniref:Uncharacterized protein n=1 Tax=Cerrena zonata TaxID=2478898 RepID=A0AAW0G1H2_9APHY